MKNDTHLVLKREWITKNLNLEEQEIFNTLVAKIKMADHSYYVVNLDEPYADEVLDVIKRNESETIDE